MNVMTSQLNRRSFLLFGMLVVVFAATSLTSLIISFKTGWADSFPNKPIRIIVPYPAGGIVDARARWIAERLSKNIGQHVIVDNRPGASTIIGADAMVRAAPDGYTLLLSSTSTFVTIPQ